MRGTTSPLSIREDKEAIAAGKLGGDKKTFKVGGVEVKEDALTSESHIFSGIWRFLKRFLFGTEQETPKMHTGGVVDATGPKFLEKGEVVLPKAYADGGLVKFQEGGQAKFSDAKFLNGETKLDSSGFEDAVNRLDSITKDFKNTVENVKLNVDTTQQVSVNVGDAVVPVDVGTAVVPVDASNVTVSIDTAGVSVPVDVGNAVVPVDTSNATINVDIGDAADRIAAAISSASVGAGGTVGAERLDILAETVQAVNDKLINVNDSVRTVIANVNSQMQLVKTNVEDKMAKIEVEVRQQLGDLRSQAADVRSSVSNVEHKYKSQLDDVIRKLNDTRSSVLSRV
jgi:hypothetical protein